MSLLSVQDLEKGLWGSVDLLRDQVDLYDFKNQVFGLFMLKRLNDVFVERVAALVAAEGMNRKKAEAAIQLQYGAFPQEARWPGLQERKKGIGEALDKAVAALEQAQAALSLGLSAVSFAGHKRLSDEVLHPLMCHFGQLSLADSQLEQPDKLGDVCEQLIRQYADASGRRGSLLLTPKPLTQLLLSLLAPEPGQSVYDPTCGTAGILLDAARYVAAQQGGLLANGQPNLQLFGQEKLASTWSLARLCFHLHQWPADIRLGDSLVSPLHVDAEGLLQTFDRVVARPPFGVPAWWTPLETPLEPNKRRPKKLKIPDYKRVRDPYRRLLYGIPPHASADFAFVQHMLASLKPDGRMVVMLPSDILSRRGEEAKIRSRLLFGHRHWPGDLLETVIALPPALFYGSAAASCVLVFCNNKPAHLQQKVIFIDASREFAKGKAQNGLRPPDIEHIVTAYRGVVSTQTEEQQYCRLVGLEEIRQHDGKLDVARYIDNGEARPLVDSEGLQSELSGLQEEELAVDERLQSYRDEQGWQLAVQETDTVLALLDDKLELLAAQLAARYQLLPMQLDSWFCRGVGIRRLGKWQAHTAFKPSPLGVVPANWELRPLGELSQLLSTELLASAMAGDMSDSQPLPAATFCYHSQQLLEQGLLLQNEVEESLPDADRVVFAIDQESLLPAYLYWYSRSTIWQRSLCRIGADLEGAEISYTQLATVLLPLPPMNEQRKLLTELEPLQASLQALQQQVEQCQLWRQQLMESLPE
ncbi:N-6 DNA methylase [Neisseriaceae bacterium TC5R-5]|nr:N-6 DNA methylase [Neisseriaceae bacterium TC5R-5]